MIEVLFRFCLGLTLGVVLGCAGASRTAVSPEDQSCEQAGDCALTRTPLGGCCETTCEARALSLDGLAREHERCGHHAKDCPVVHCDDDEAFADCVRGRCVVRR